MLVNTIRSNHCIFSHLNKITSSYNTINVDLIFKFVLYYAYPFSRSTFLTLVQLWPFMNLPFSSFYKWPKYLNILASHLLQHFIIIMSPKKLNSFQQVRISIEKRDEQCGQWKFVPAVSLLFIPTAFSNCLNCQNLWNLSLCNW